MLFCVIPATVGLLYIFFNLLVVFNEESGMFYHNFNWAFLSVFLGLVLISHSIISVANLCKCE